MSDREQVMDNIIALLKAAYDFGAKDLETVRADTIAECVRRMRESSHWSLKSSANWLEAEMKK